MSTDLELRLPIIKMAAAPRDSDKTADADSDSCVSEEECQTPRSPEHMIPAVVCCPPAPRKPRRRSSSCKRKLCELDFFEIVAESEIESFFRRAEENCGGGGGAAAKRRCVV